MSTPAQIFYPVPNRTGLYNRERDLETAYAVDKGTADRIEAQIELRRGNSERVKNLVIAKISSGGLYVNEIQVG